MTQYKFLASTITATTGTLTESGMDASSDVGEIWNEAVDRYEKDTETKFKKIKRVNNADDVLAHIQVIEGTFKKHRHDGSKTDKFRTLMSKALDPIDRIGNVVAGAASMVRTDALPIC